MSNTINVIIFSAGESIKNGNVEKIRNCLNNHPLINCIDWSDLFYHSNNKNNISLLPNLIKKIPTFDFAIILAESVDQTIRHNKTTSTMRDNVLFELGLSIMGLGTDHVILLKDEEVLLPEDLISNTELNLKTIEFNRSNFTNKIQATINYILINYNTFSLVLVSSAITSAEAYFQNFILRLLLNIHKGYVVNNEHHNIKKFKLIICVPTYCDFQNDTFHQLIDDFYQSNQLKKYKIENAGSRDLYFRGIEKKDQLYIIDLPTSITASYSTIKQILNTNSDESYDDDAEVRFIHKECDVFYYTLQSYIHPDYVKNNLGYILHDTTNFTINKLLNNNVEIRKINL